MQTLIIEDANTNTDDDVSTDADDDVNAKADGVESFVLITTWEWKPYLPGAKQQIMLISSMKLFINSSRIV